jgi:hypothetical protein
MASLSVQGERKQSGSFVGHERDLSELRASLPDLTVGHGHVFLLSGEPRIGKIRLADEGGAYARLPGAQVLLGNCYDGDEASPYSSFVESIREYSSTRPDDVLSAGMGGGISDLATLIPEIGQPVPRLHAFNVCRSEGTADASARQRRIVPNQRLECQLSDVAARQVAPGRQHLLCAFVRIARFAKAPFTEFERLPIGKFSEPRRLQTGSGPNLGEHAR